MRASTLLAAACLSRALAAPFTAGNLVVLRVGDGNILGTGVYRGALLEMTTTGTLVQTIALSADNSPPAGGACMFYGSGGSSDAEGKITRFANGAGLVVAAYNNVDGQPFSTSSFTAALVGVDGTVDYTTTWSATGNSIRGAATSDGSFLYVSTSGGLKGIGARTQLSAPIDMTATGSASLSQVDIVNNDVYVYVVSFPYGVAKVFTAPLPPFAPQPAPTFSGLIMNGTAAAFSAGAAFLFESSSALWVASYLTGLQRLTQATPGGPWVPDTPLRALAFNRSDGVLVTATGIKSLAGARDVNNNFELYLITKYLYVPDVACPGNYIVKYTPSTGAAIAIYQAADNYNMPGLAWAPIPAVSQPTATNTPFPITSTRSSTPLPSVTPAGFCRAPASAPTPFRFSSVVALRVGGRTGVPVDSLSPVAREAFLDEIDSVTGEIVQTIALPVGLPTYTFNNASAPVPASAGCLMNGGNRLAGLISRSADGNFLAVAGIATVEGATGTTLSNAVVSTWLVGMDASITLSGLTNSTITLGSSSVGSTFVLSANDQALTVSGAATKDGSSVWYSCAAGTIAVPRDGNSQRPGQSFVASSSAGGGLVVGSDGWVIRATTVLGVQVIGNPNGVAATFSGVDCCGSPVDRFGSSLLLPGISTLPLTSDSTTRGGLWMTSDLSTLFLADTGATGAMLACFMRLDASYGAAELPSWAACPGYPLVSLSVPGVSAAVVSLSAIAGFGDQPSDVGGLYLVLSSPAGLLRFNASSRSATLLASVPAGCPAGVRYAGLARAPSTPLPLPSPSGSASRSAAPSPGASASPSRSGSPAATGSNTARPSPPATQSPGATSAGAGAADSGSASASSGASSLASAAGSPSASPSAGGGAPPSASPSAGGAPPSASPSAGAPPSASPSAGPSLSPTGAPPLSASRSPAASRSAGPTPYAAAYVTGDKVDFTLALGGGVTGEAVRASFLSLRMGIACYLDPGFQAGAVTVTAVGATAYASNISINIEASPRGCGGSQRRRAAALRVAEAPTRASAGAAALDGPRGLQAALVVGISVKLPAPPAGSGGAGLAAAGAYAARIKASISAISGGGGPGLLSALSLAGFLDDLAAAGAPVAAFSLSASTPADRPASAPAEAPSPAGAIIGAIAAVLAVVGVGACLRRRALARDAKRIASRGGGAPRKEAELGAPMQANNPMARLQGGGGSTGGGR